MALEKFCLCCKLRNGAVIWGCLCIIGSLITLIVTVSSDIFVERVATKILYDNVVNDGDFPYSRFNYDTMKTPVFWLVVATSSVNVLLSILLVIGAVKRNHFLMLPWIIVYGIVTIPFAIASFLLLIIGLPIYGPVYIWWCICSAYQKVQENIALPYTNFVTLSSPDTNNSQREMILEETE